MGSTHLSLHLNCSCLVSAEHLLSTSAKTDPSKDRYFVLNIFGHFFIAITWIFVSFSITWKLNPNAFGEPGKCSSAGLFVAQIRSWKYFLNCKKAFSIAGGFVGTEAVKCCGYFSGQCLVKIHHLFYL